MDQGRSNAYHHAVDWLDRARKAYLRLDRAGAVAIEIIDLRGRVVRRLELGEQAAGLVDDLEADSLQFLIGVHISEVNNTADLARASLARAAGARADDIEIVCQRQGLDWRVLD